MDLRRLRANMRETGIIEELELENIYRNPHKNYPQWNALLHDFVTREPNINLLLNASVLDADVAGRPATRPDQRLDRDRSGLAAHDAVLPHRGGDALPRLLGRLDPRPAHRRRAPLGTRVEGRVRREPRGRRGRRQDDGDVVSHPASRDERAADLRAAVVRSPVRARRHRARDATSTSTAPTSGGSSPAARGTRSATPRRFATICCRSQPVCGTSLSATPTSSTRATGRSTGWAFSRASARAGATLATTSSRSPTWRQADRSKTLSRTPAGAWTTTRPVASTSPARRPSSTRRPRPGASRTARSTRGRWTISCSPAATSARRTSRSVHPGS